MNDYVNSILVDHSGNLWFGTDWGYGGGVSRFDGVRWTTFTTADGLPQYSVHAIAEDHSGNIWFGTIAGATRFDGTSWKTFTADDGLAGDDVRTIAVDHAGNVWCATYDGVSRFDGVKWKAFTTADGLAATNVHAIAEDASGNLWFGFAYGGIGVSRFDGTSWKTFTSADGLAGNYVNAIARDRSGNLWFGTDGGASRFDGSTWKTFTTADGLAANLIYAIAPDPSGYLWFGTADGVSRFNGIGWRTFTETDGLTHNAVSAVAADSSGDLWFGFTDCGQAFCGFGVTRFDGTNWKTIAAADGLPIGVGQPLMSDHVGNLWAGTPYYGVRRFDGTSWTTFATADGLPSDYILSLAEDHLGNIWVGTNAGVSRFDGVTWRSFTRADGLSGDGVQAIVEDSSSSLWFGTNNGVSIFNGTSWSTVDSSDYVDAMTVDPSGNIWIAGNKGVSRFDGKTWRTFTAADGPADGAGMAIAADRSGNVWLGGVNGVSRFDGSTWTIFTTSDGIASNFTNTIAVARSGSVWFGGGEGLSCYRGGRWTAFTTNDGLLGNGVEAITEDRSGSLWFAYYDVWALTRYEPDRVPPRTVFITAPPLVGTSRTPSATFVAAFGETQGVQFSSRLDGGPWSPWEAVGSWSRVAVPDGVHKIEARSRDKSNNVEATPASATFEVDATPPAPIIASPLFAQPVQGAVEIRGTAADSRFRQYRLDVRPAGASSWDPPVATMLAQSSIQVTDGTLATWNTSSLPDGNYELRLAVSDSLGLTGAAQVAVIVDNHAPYADVTAPARVSAASGGHVFTTNSELNLYFPPHAFPQDALVMIAPSTSAPDTLLSGAVRVLPAYDLSWGSSSLRKPATLEFSSAGRQPDEGALAIYFSPDGITWQRLGGTAEPQKVSLAVQNPGRYALFSEKSLWNGPGHLSSLSFTPRVFSVANRFADDHVAIGFSLGRAAPVTVRIYNRAGRLVRSLVEGQQMGAGENLVRWNGTDRADVRVADGIYLVTVEALGETRRNTIAVVR